MIFNKNKKQYDDNIHLKVECGRGINVKSKKTSKLIAKYVSAGEKFSYSIHVSVFMLF